MTVPANTQLCKILCGQTMIMISARRLDMGMIIIQPKVYGTAKSLIVPVSVPVTVPELGSARVEEHSIERNTQGTIEGAAGTLVIVHRADPMSGLGISRNFKIIVLLSDRVWVPAIGERADQMCRDTVGPEHAFALDDPNAVMIFCLWSLRGWDQTDRPRPGHSVFPHSRPTVLGLGKDQRCDAKDQKQDRYLAAVEEKDRSLEWFLRVYIVFSGLVSAPIMCTFDQYRVALSLHQWQVHPGKGLREYRMIQ